MTNSKFEKRTFRQRLPGKGGSALGKETAQKQLEEYDDVFIDIFDNLLFEGRGFKEQDADTSAWGRGCEGP